MEWYDKLLDPAVLGTMIPLAVIIGFFAKSIVGRITTHRERLAMIEQGMHPDQPPLPEYAEDAERALPPRDRSSRLPESTR